MAEPSILKLALKKVKFDKDDKPASKKGDDLEVAIREFNEATTDSAKARAFRSAIKLAQAD